MDNKVEEFKWNSIGLRFILKQFYYLNLIFRIKLNYWVL